MMFPEVMEGSRTQLPYFRTDEFSEMMLDSERVLKNLLNAGDESKVAFLTASGTGGMEAAVINFFDRFDRLLIVSGGGFGHRFCEICDVHNIPYDAIELKFGEVLTEELLNEYKGFKHTGMLVNLDETSTGQLYDIKLISDFCKSEGMYLVVDAISSFLADPLDMKSDGVDAVILSSQKALSLAPGLSIVVMSDRIYERSKSVHSPSYYLDLSRHVSDQKRGQTPFTPAVGVLLDLNRMLHLIDDIGLREKIMGTAELANYFRSNARTIGLKIPEYPLSNAVTPLLFDGNAYDVFVILREKYGITVTPSGGDLRGKLLRVGHIGNLTKKDYDRLLSALKEVIG